MDERVLKLHYENGTIDIVIEDKDKCQLMEVINEYHEKAEKKGIELPENPGFSYTHRQEEVKLLEDKDLVGLFDLYPKQKVFIIWVCSDEHPSKVLTMARLLRTHAPGASNGTSTALPPPPLPPLTQKLEVRRRKPNPQITSPPTSPSQIRRSPKIAFTSLPTSPPPHVWSPIAELRSPSTSPSNFSPRESKNERRLRLNIERFKQLESLDEEPLIPTVGTPYSQPPPIPTPLSQPTPTYTPFEQSTCSSTPFEFTKPRFAPHQKKVPKTTAVQLGTFIPKPKSSVPTPINTLSSQPAPKASKCRATPSTLTPSSQPAPTSPPSQSTVRIIRSSVPNPIQTPTPQMPTRRLICHHEDGTLVTSNDTHESLDDYSDEEFQSSEDDVAGENRGTREDYVTGEDYDFDEDDVIDENEMFEVVDPYDPYANPVFKSEDDGDYFDKIYMNGEMYENKEFGAITLKPWNIFSDREHFKDVLKDFCIQEGFCIIVRKADNLRYTAECDAVGCDWRIHASCLPDSKTWAIKSIRCPQHKCTRLRTYNPLADKEWVGKQLMEDVRANPEIKGRSLNALLYKRFGLYMRTSSLYKMKAWVLNQIRGGHDESYGYIPAYYEMIKISNPGSKAHYTKKTLDTPERSLQFRSIFVSFAAQFNGVIRCCRGLIGVDGTHLKGNYGGVLLTAIALDANNELFPLAHCIVDSESKNSWSHFFWHLKDTLKDSGRDDWTIISDRQKEVEPALEKVWPTVDRRYCCRHLAKNFKSSYPGVLMHKLFWRACNAYSEFTFRKTMERIEREAGLGAVQWFKKLGHQSKWSKYRFNPRLSCEENTSNFVESYNSTIGADKFNLVLTLHEGIRRTNMVRLATRQKAAEKWDENGICPNIRRYLNVLIKDSRACHVFASADGEYEIQDGRSYLPVSLKNRTCACGQWQVSGIPCRHAIRAIDHERHEPADYVNEWFTVRRYKLAYGMSIKTMPDHERWPQLDVPTLIPPPSKRGIGRPSRNRRLEEREKRKGKRSTTVQCQKCKAYGHNSKTCKGGFD